MQLTLRFLWRIWIICLFIQFSSTLLFGDDNKRNSVADIPRLDETGGFIHLSPGVVHTNNGCSQFTVSIVATLTNAHVFGLTFGFDQANLSLISIMPGSDTTLHLLPHQLGNDTLRLDGFFSPNYTAGSLVLARLTCNAISVSDLTTQIGFIGGQGLGGTAEAPDPIIFSGDTSTIIIDGTAALPPASMIIIPYHSPVPFDDSVGVFWRPVTIDLHGNAVTHPLYTVYFHDILHDSSFILGSTVDTFYYNNYITHSYMPGDTGTVNAGEYWIRVCKTQP
jgi:hypothetical protein